MTTTATRFAAADMLRMLQRHYLPESRPPGGIFAPEIQAPGGGRRADLIWQGVTARTGYELVGHEIKVNRGDVLAELDDPTKSDAWMQYCDRWYLVVPTLDLVDGLNLPATWGVMLPPSGRRTRSMAIAVPAPALKPREQAPALRTLATWLHWRRLRVEAELDAGRAQWTRDLAELEDLRRRAPRPEAERRRTAQEQLVAAILDQVGVSVAADGTALLGGWRLDIDAADVVTTLTGLAEVRAAERRIADDLRHRLRDVARLRDDLTRVLDQQATEERS